MDEYQFDKAAHVKQEKGKITPDPEGNEILLIDYLDGSQKVEFYCPLKGSKLETRKGECPAAMMLEVNGKDSKWTAEIHEDGTLSMNPSIHVVGCCHYFIKRNKITGLSFD